MNIYLKAALKTLAFVAYVVFVVVGFVMLKNSVGVETASNIFYGALAVFGIAVIFMLNLARAKFHSKD